MCGGVLLCPGGGVSWGLVPVSPPHLLWFIPAPPALAGCWEPLAVPRSAVVCLILPGSVWGGGGSWDTGGTPLSIVPLLVCPSTTGSCPCPSPPSFSAAPNRTWGSRGSPCSCAGGGGTSLVAVCRGGGGGLEVAGNTRTHGALLLCLSFPIAWADGVQLTPHPRWEHMGAHSHRCLEKQGSGCQQKGGRDDAPLLVPNCAGRCMGSDPGQVFPMRSALTVGVLAARGQIRGRGAGDGGAFAGENLLGEGREGRDSHRSLGPTWLPGGAENSPRHLSHQPPQVGT